jgi:hypothetical protein
MVSWIPFLFVILLLLKTKQTHEQTEINNEASVGTQASYTYAGEIRNPKCGTRYAVLPYAHAPMYEV